MRVVSLIAASLILFAGELQAANELPEKVSFDLAMKLVDEGRYHDLVTARAELESAVSDQLSAQGVNDLAVNLTAQAQYIEPSEVVGTEENDDHKLSLTVTKTLLDFGYANNLVDAADIRVRSTKLLLDQVRLYKRLEVARLFFDVKLSDLEFALDNERIATAYVKFNKTQERNELKMASDVDLLEAQFEYQQVRAHRYQSEVNQRISRSRFAESIARPGDLPSEVVVPDLGYISAKRPEYEELLKQAMANNLQLRAQQMRVEAAQKNLEASRNKGGSTLSSEIEWAEYSNEAPSKNDFRATLKYNIPLYESDSVKSDRARAQSQLYAEQARLQKMESEIRQQLLEAWQAIYVLQARQETDAVAQEYRELYQDRSRAYYEMEYRTDLGDSFVRVSEARLEKYRNQFDLAIAWMKLAMLTGQTLEEFLKQ